MKYVKILSTAVACVWLGVSCTTERTKHEFTGFTDDFNSVEHYAATWGVLADSMPGKVEYITDADGNGMVMVTSEERTAQGVKHRLTGLNPECL